MKHLNSVIGLEGYTKYGVDEDGNIWSFQHNTCRKLRPGSRSKKYPYLFVYLSDRHKKKKKFYVHRLVATAFIPTDDYTLQVNHINRNPLDNRVTNLEWCTGRQNMDHLSSTKGFELDNFLILKFKKLHAASLVAGIPVPDPYSLMNSIIEAGIETYIDEYGLRQIMNLYCKK